jgi:cyclase
MRLPQILGALLLASVAGSVSAQQEDLSRVEIRSTPLGANLYLLSGAGGNIAALTGAEGVLLVDDEFGALAEKIRAALKALGAGQPPRFIIDTHYHYDHTDGNEAFARMGTLVIAQAQLRSRLVTGGTASNGGSIVKEMKPAPPGGLPGLTYEQELTLYLDGETVRVHHYPHAHTDGDSVVFFPLARAVHMGDIFVRYGFPFIDTNGGGTVQGMLAACEDVIKTVPADTQIIPGHGEVATIADLREYAKMLADTSALVARAVKAHKTLKQMQDEKLLGAWSARYSPPKAFVDTDAYTQSLYNSYVKGGRR